MVKTDPRKIVIWTIKVKLMVLFLLVPIIPGIIGSALIYRDTSKAISYTKLNEQMNIIDAKYIHLLDFLKDNNDTTLQLSREPHINEPFSRHYKTRGNPASPSKTIDINSFLTAMKDESILSEHIMKGERENGTRLEEVFGRAVKWDIYNLDERLYRYEEIFLIDKFGKVFASSNAKTIGNDLSNKELFTKGI